MITLSVKNIVLGAEIFYVGVQIHLCNNWTHENRNFVFMTKLHVNFRDLNGRKNGAHMRVEVRWIDAELFCTFYLCAKFILDLGYFAFATAPALSGKNPLSSTSEGTSVRGKYRSPLVLIPFGSNVR